MFRLHPKFNGLPLKAMMGLEDDPASYWGPKTIFLTGALLLNFGGG